MLSVVKVFEVQHCHALMRVRSSMQSPANTIVRSCVVGKQHVVDDLPWSSYLRLRLLFPQTTVDALAAPLLAFLAGFLCRTRVTRFKTAIIT